MLNMDNDILIKVEGVSKKFCKELKTSLKYGVYDLTNEVLGRSHGTELRQKEFWSVNDVNFELRRGETLGLIGRNGAGKTTLLRMLNGLIKPDKGRIEMRGRVGALIALGAGFNPILSGRENIYVNASVLGLTKNEIESKLDEIVDFAEIGEFIDTPLQNYSSGMQVRLGFAVATALNPDVLLLDEVLAVGDAAFRNKCYNRIGQLCKSAAIVFVSHSMDQVAQVCDIGLFLSRGKPKFYGSLQECILAYEKENSFETGEEVGGFESVSAPITNVSFTLSPIGVLYGDWMKIQMDVCSDSKIEKVILRIVFYDERQLPFAEWNSDRIGLCFDIEKGRNKFEVDIGPLLFKKGCYKLGINLNDNTGLTMLVWSYKRHQVSVESFTQVGTNVAFHSPLKHL